MTRLLPGVYSSLNDLSQVPEGVQSLNVGYVLKANRGPVNEWNLVTSPTDFLTKYTFSGAPSQTDDPTFHSIIKVLAQTNSMYVVRAANDPLYGGVIIKKSKVYGEVVSVSKDNETITIDGTEVPEVGETIMVSGTNIVDGYYVVKEVTGKVIKVTGDITRDYGKIADVTSVVAETNSFVVSGDVTSIITKDSSVSVKFVKENEVTILDYTVASATYDEETTKTTIVVKESIVIPEGATATAIYRYGQATGGSLLRNPVVPLGYVKIEDISSAVASEKAFYLKEYTTASKIAVGDIITVKGATETSYGDNNGNYTVVLVEPDMDANKTKVVVKEAIVDGTDGVVYFNSLKNPEGFKEFFAEDDLMLITGNNPGAYNGKEAFEIVSALDNKNQMVYYKGATGLFPEPCTFDTMQLSVINSESKETLETFMFSRDPEAKAIDGSLLFVDDIVSGSAYIKIVNNSDNTDVPNSTLSGAPVQASGGSDGDAVTSADLAKALTVFEDKTIPVSILGNGCSVEAESLDFQQALISLASTRQDMFVFLNSPKNKETATLLSDRAQGIVDYKKNELANTSFYGCMYAPHVKTPDIFNSRNVEIGSDAVAIAGWLNVINNLNYPYAYAGPRNGLVSGVTCDWKIGDMSGEAQSLNDASVNYIAYDGRVGRYYMQCQNTLQVASSAMRNIGVVLNVLDIKETLITDLKEYINLPITDDLRRDILDTVNDYLSPMVGTRFYNYAFQDTTTANDLDNDTLRYLLTISPTRYANRIYLVMNIVRASFDFSILQSV